MALIDSWMPSRTRGSFSPARWRLSNSTCKQIQRLDIGQAQPDGGIQRRMLLQQARLPGDGQQAFVRGLPGVADAAEHRMRRARDPRPGWHSGAAMPMSDFDSTISRLSSVARKNGHASSISRSSAAVAERAQRLADAVPARQHDARLRPAEHPGDRAQILDAMRVGARCRPRADLQLRDLAQRRHLPEEGRKALGLVDQRAIGAGMPPATGRPSRPRIAADRCVRTRSRSPAMPARSPTVIDSRFAAGAFGGAVLGGDDFALLGNADAAAAPCRAAARGWRRTMSRRRGPRRRRGRGISACACRNSSNTAASERVAWCRLQTEVR